MSMISLRSAFAVAFGMTAGWMLPVSAQEVGKTKDDSSTVVASQGGVSVTLGELDAYAASRIPEKDRAGFFNSPQRIEMLITNQLVQKQMAAEARKAGLQNDPMVKSQIELAADETLSKARLERLRKEIKVPDFTALAKEEYSARKEKYVTPGRFDVKHILITTNNRTDAEAKALAETVEKEAKADPGQFDALVEKYSEDPSKTANLGLMSQVDSGRYVTEFSDAAKALKNPGDISPIVKTKFGYHVLKLIARTPQQQRSFADVRDEIISRMSSEYVDKQMKNYTDQLRNQKMDASPDVVASLRDRYVKPQQSAESAAPAKTP